MNDNEKTVAMTCIICLTLLILMSGIIGCENDRIKQIRIIKEFENKKMIKDVNE